MLLRFFLFFMLGLAVRDACAAGFALIEQSGTGLGNAYAGMAARSDNSSIQYYNPASLSFLESGSHISIGAHLIIPSAEFKNGTAKSTTFGNLPITGNEGGDAGKVAVVPNLYFSGDLSQQVKYGLGISAPFGLATEYKNGWLGRYHALESELKTININPVLSWKASDNLAFAGGISIQYADAKLTNAIDSSGICRAKAPAATCNALGLGQPGNANKDSYADLEGNDTSWGYNFGFIYKPTSLTTIGASYRSYIKHTLEGDASFKRSPSLNTLLTAAGSTLLTNTGLKADLSVPETLSLSVAHQPSDKLELLADITWTNWSRFRELRIKFDNPAQADAVTTTRWEDSYRFSVGANYLIRPQLKLNLGIAYDQTPVPSPQYRTPRIPDQDRTWLAIGASWQLSENSNVDIGYAHLFMDKAKINSTTEGGIKQNLQGEFDPNVNILSVQYAHKF